MDDEYEKKLKLQLQKFMEENEWNEEHIELEEVPEEPLVAKEQNSSPPTHEEMMKEFQRTLIDRALFVVEVYANHRSAIEEVIRDNNLPETHHLHKTRDFFEELMKYQVSLIPSDLLPQA